MTRCTTGSWRGGRGDLRGAAGRAGDVSVRQPRVRRRDQGGGGDVRGDALEESPLVTTVHRGSKKPHIATQCQARLFNWSGRRDLTRPAASTRDDQSTSPPARYTSAHTRAVPSKTRGRCNCRP